MINKLLISNYNVPINSLTFPFKSQKKILNDKKEISFYNSYIFSKEKFLKISEIEKEKRKRFSMYKFLNYYLCNITYFDFFSPNCFKHITNIKFLINLNNNKNEFENLFLLLFFLIYSESLKLNDLKLEKKSINIKINKQPLLFDNNIMKLFNIHKSFLLCIYNNVNKFKNPVINSKLFLINLIENNSNLIKILFKSKLKSKLNIIKYYLLEQLYNEEILIKKQIEQKNNYFFVYLFRIFFSEEIITKLIKFNILNKIIKLFRNRLIKYILNNNIFSSFESETYFIIFYFSRRYYFY